MTHFAGDFPPAAAEDAEGVHRSARVRPQASFDRAHQEGGSHWGHHVPALHGAEVRGDRLLRGGQQLSGVCMFMRVRLCACVGLCGVVWCCVEVVSISSARGMDGILHVVLT